MGRFGLEYLRSDGPAIWFFCVGFSFDLCRGRLAVFNDDLEDEIQLAVGKEYFFQVRDAVAANFGYAKPSGALKNPEVAAALVRAIYTDGKAVPILEEIVTKITALKTG